MFVCLLLGMGVPLTVLAHTLIAPADLHRFASLCTGMPVPLATLPLSANRLLVLDARGRLSSLHAQMPATLRADTADAVGLVLCTDERELQTGSCNFGFLGEFPRIRQQLGIRAFAVTRPEAAVLATTLAGTAPPACDQAGILAPGSKIRGSLPGLAAMLAELDAAQVSAADADADGYSNLHEQILGSDPHAATSPGPLLQVTVNASKLLTLADTQTALVAVSLQPGLLQGEAVDYYLLAETPQGRFAYRHPGGFVAGEERALRHPALQFADLEVLALQGLAAGTYSLRFMLVTDEGKTHVAQAAFTVVPPQWRFTEVALQAGFAYLQGYSEVTSGITRDLAVLAGGGVAAGDYDGDGWTDLYVTRGTLGPNLLFRNRGDGTFEERGAAAGVALSGRYNSGAIFADYDGDGHSDLFVSGFNDSPSTLFRNNGDGSFSDVTQAAGLSGLRQSFSAAFGDYDLDGDPDLWVSHYLFNTQGGWLWRNNGDGSFTDVSMAAGIFSGQLKDWSATFADIDEDGWPDILVAGDFHTSQLYRNNQNGTFARLGGSWLTDENAMGGAVGDYDNDGDLDWFLSSIHDPEGPQRAPGTVTWGFTGNRFYRNTLGSFADVSSQNGTREGGWGWGSCMQDFNNDGVLDLFHTNGFHASAEMLTLVFRFARDRSRLFVGNGSGGFAERSAELGLVDEGQGRGIVCLDYDNDGDIDIFTANNEQAPTLFRNDGGNHNNWLDILVAGEGGNTEGVGARVYVTVGHTTQLRELHAGSNYLSNDPLVAHVGLGSATHADKVLVLWPSGNTRELTRVQANRTVLIRAE